MNHPAELAVNMPSAQERVRREHAIEWCYRWQYAVTHRTLRGLTPDQARDIGLTGPPAELLVPPDGDGWEINVDYADHGYHVRVPRWVTDVRAALMQSVHWRRPNPAMEWGSPGRKISICRDPE